jgi:hypothetical protein
MIEICTHFENRKLFYEKFNQEDEAKNNQRNTRH